MGERAAQLGWLRLWIWQVFTLLNPRPIGSRWAFPLFYLFPAGNQHSSHYLNVPALRGKRHTLWLITSCSSASYNISGAPHGTQGVNLNQQVLLLANNHEEWSQTFMGITHQSGVYIQMDHDVCAWDVLPFISQEPIVISPLPCHYFSWE